MVGVVLCFFIVRVMGCEVVEKLIGKIVFDSMDGFFICYGKYIILVCWLLFFVSFDLISYVVGLTLICFCLFFIVIGFG